MRKDLKSMAVLFAAAALALGCSKNEGENHGGRSTVYDADTKMSQYYAKGSGTESDPYLISSAADFKRFVVEANKPSYLQDDANKYHKLATDIKIDMDVWSPISWFAGHLDGGGHTVSGKLTSSDKDSSFGFFKSITGSVRNLTLDATVESRYDGKAWECITGGLAVGLSGEISNCIVKGSVKGGKNSDTYNNTAGIIANAGPGAVIEKCVNYAEVTGGESTSETGSNYSCTGGLVAKFSGRKFSECENHGAVTGGTAHGRGLHNKCCTGGIFGELYDYYGDTVISDCLNTGAITGGSSHAHCYTGGIVGYSLIPLHRLENSGAVTQGTTTENPSTGFLYTGGIAGQMGYEAKVYTCCVNTGWVIGATQGTSILVGSGSVGTCNSSHSVD